MRRYAAADWARERTLKAQRNDKAFDKVPHRRLLAKFEALGIWSPVLDIIGSCLSNLFQKVVIAGSRFPRCVRFFCEPTLTEINQEEVMTTNQEEPLDFTVNENTMTSEGSELTFQSAQGDCEDCTVDSFCASESPGKPIPFISPMTGPVSKDCDSLQRGADHQAWGDHALPRAATDTFLPSPPACNAIVNGGRVPAPPSPPPPCPAPTPADSQVSMLSLDSEASESLRNDANDETVVSSVLGPVRTAPVPLTAAACSTSTESVDAINTRTERVAPATGLYRYESRSYSPAHLVVDTCPPPSEAVRNLVEGRPSLSSPCISCRSQSFFPPSGDQQGGIDVNVRLTMTLPAENPAIVEASSSVVFTTFFRERFKMEHGDSADATQPSVVLTAQADSRATASFTAHGRNNAASRQANPEEQASTSSRQSSQAAAPDISTVQEELDQLPLAEEGSLEERVACHLARIGDEINRLYGSRFDQIIKRLPEDQDSLEIFSNVARIFFTRRPTNWGQIISLFYFGYRLAVRRLARGIVGAVVQVVQSLVSYCRNLDIFGWIANQGGWRILEYLSLVRPQESVAPSMSMTSSAERTLTADNDHDDNAIIALARIISSVGINRQQVQYTLIGAGVTLIFATVLTVFRRR
ncbi:bcl-2 ous antagonist killer [Sparganum proliferum]